MKKTLTLTTIFLLSFFFPLFGKFLWVAVAIFAVITVFQIVTLPVEFDASRRAKLVLTNRGLVTLDESRGAESVLNAAALTYVAAFLTALFHLLYLISLRDRR